MISVKNLSKTFISQRSSGGIIKSLFYREKIAMHAVNSLSFEIAPGEFVGFVGPNGAGKTTTLKMLSGILHPTSGSATVMGYIPWERRPEFQKKFSLVMGQKNQLWWDLPPVESFDFNKAVYEIPDAMYKAQLAMLTELLGLAPFLHTPVRKLSLGERMKCELACALLHRPQILFLDEPTIGLDVVSQKKIRDFLTEYNRSSGATIILTSHYMEDIRRLCNRVIIIDHGRLIYDGTYRELVAKHANTKTIEVVFSEPVKRDQIERHGRLAEFKDTTARLIVPRAQSARITATLLNDFPIDDISIHEESMEDIVGKIFQGQ